jgi:hypothetical protein
MSRAKRRGIRTGSILPTDETPGCLGFTIVRHEDGGASEVPTAWVGFEGDEDGRWTPRTTDEWPV